MILNKNMSQDKRVLAPGTLSVYKDQGSGIWKGKKYYLNTIPS